MGKKILCTMLCVCLAVTMLGCGNTNADTKLSYTQVGTTIHSGEIAGLTWGVTDAGELIVTGEVNDEAALQELRILDDYGRVTKWNLPWKEYGEDTTTVYMAFSGATDLSYLFGDVKSSYPNLISVDMHDMDTSNVTDMKSMFDGCSSLTSVDLSSFNTSKVTDMEFMFHGCSSLTSADLSSFDTSNVTNMRWMFSGCSSLTSVDLSSFDTNNVTDVISMFANCSSLTSADLSNFDTSNVTNMGGMFYACNSLTSVDISSFDTSNVMDMNGMFNGCSSLLSLDVSSFDTRQVVNMDLMFSSCGSLKKVIVGDGWQMAEGNCDVFTKCGVSEVTHK